ncbi:hypothetical protein MTR62_06225 [Novosphingobium sp. 1949]|uniref:Mlr4354 like protein n=1 Tax=Novosphingobium organovorum TaxID=2930092 RepID=A0ABT0BBS1_9SPHN|nr:hypothetical protein [Novosphingobium organovorum]MCJ2182298.1 hypothetical protein [Novosphingobium organovorum]
MVAIASVFRTLSPVCLAALCTLSAGAASARESLGLYEQWGAFRDPIVPRCYAIAEPAPSALWRDYQPFAAIGTWPRRDRRNQLHFRVSRKMAPDTTITLRIGPQRFTLIGGGGDAWPASDTDNAAITAAMRSASEMTLYATGARGGRFSNTWQLAGAASAMDAALLGCASQR